MTDLYPYAPPWGSTTTWKAAKWNLDYLIQLHRPELDRAVNFAREVQFRLESIFPLMDDLLWNERTAWPSDLLRKTPVRLSLFGCCDSYCQEHLDGVWAAELDRRLAEFQRGDVDAIAWSELRDQT